MFNEAGLISRSSARFPEPLFQGRERADPAGEFNQGSPTRRGKVKPYHPPPFQNQEPAEQDKQNEREMEKHEESRPAGDRKDVDTHLVLRTWRANGGGKSPRFKTKTSKRPEKN